MAKLKHTTFRFDEQLKEEFKNEVESNGFEMTEVIVQFMTNYVKISKNGRG